MMKEVYRHSDVTRVGFYKSILDDEGIACFIRNQYADGSVFGAGAVDFCPTLCITNDDDYSPALQLLANHEYRVVEGGADWICPNCKEKVPGEFSSCWNCHTVIDQAVDAETGDDELD